MGIGELLQSANLQGLWHFNGNSNDASPNSNNGADTSIAYNTGLFGQNALFNGSSSFIALANNAGLTVTGDFTIMHWIKLTNNGKIQVMFSKNNPDTNPGGYMWAVNASNMLRFTVRGVVDIDDTGAVSLGTGVWTHVALIHTGSNYNFYINSKQNSSVSNATNPNSQTAAPDFGRSRIGVAENWLDGAMDEFAFYNAAKTEPFLKNYYNWAKGRFARVV